MNFPLRLFPSTRLGVTRPLRATAASLASLAIVAAGLPGSLADEQGTDGDRREAQPVSAFSPQATNPADRDADGAIAFGPEAESEASGAQETETGGAIAEPDPLPEAPPEAVPAPPLVPSSPEASATLPPEANAAPPAADSPADADIMYLEETSPAKDPEALAQKTFPEYAKLYDSPTTLGVVAVGVAEGTYRLFVEGQELYVEPTLSYYGHIDPGNLSWGATVTNYGPCSDQGRSGGNLMVAERQCVERLRSRLPVLLKDLYAQGIDPYVDLEALLNAADLYNQASPVHSRQFPKALKIAREGGLQGAEAYAWARTASFYLDDRDRLDIHQGVNRASGLIGICTRENRGVSQWECVLQDQMRRVRAIEKTYRGYLQLAEGKLAQD